MPSSSKIVMGYAPRIVGIHHFWRSVLNDMLIVPGRVSDTTLSVPIGAVSNIVFTDQVSDSRHICPKTCILGASTALLYNHLFSHTWFLSTFGMSFTKSRNSLLGEVGEFIPLEGSNLGYDHILPALNSATADPLTLTSSGNSHLCCTLWQAREESENR